MIIKRILTIVVAVLLAGGMIGLCVGLGVHFGKKDSKPTAGKDAFYILDAKHGWQWSKDNMFAVDESADTPDNVITQYVYTAFYEEGSEVKIWKGSDDWSYNNPEQSWDFCEVGENIRFTKSGTYRFYLKLYTDGGNSLYIEKADEVDAQNLYVDLLRLNPLRPYDETQIKEYNKFRLYIYTSPNYNGDSFYTPLYLDNPLKTGKPVVYSGEAGYKKEYDGEVQYLPYTLTLMPDKSGNGVEITVNGSELIHINSSFTWNTPLGLIYRY